MAFAKLYPLYVTKVTRKGRSQDELDRVICWLTGYDQAGLRNQIDRNTDIRGFFDQAPDMHLHRDLIKGVICGVRVEEVEDPLMKNIRQLDKLVDELAKGRPMEKILRQ